MRAPKLVEEVQRIVGDLDGVAGDLDEARDLLGRDPEGFAEREVGVRPRRRIRAIVGAPPDELPELVTPAPADIERTIDGARSVVHKIQEEGVNADLDSDDIAGAEAIILLLGRPAILIQEGSFFPPPRRWAHLEDDRKAIERTIASVCRVEVNGHHSLDWVGTGFLVADDVVMTNRHVVTEFARPGARGRWEFEAKMEVHVDFAEEFGGSAPVEFPVDAVLGVHDRFDLALLRVVDPGRAPSLPPPLPLSAKGRVRKGKEVYVVGFPASDSRRNDPVEMQRIFSGVYNVKRLQPGEVRTVSTPRSLVSHDCSTLGGNSGSCVVDLASHEVVGLHFQGRYLEANWAVALWRLADDPLLRRHKIQFASA